MDVEITELEKIDADRVDGVRAPASGIPILLMKGLAEPVAKGGHPPFTGTHSHAHPALGSQDGDETHEHEHSHDGDADHGHSHAAKAEFDREAAKALVKAIVGRKVDETSDIAGGTAVLAQIADLIIAEATELKAGQAGEIADIQQLACAAEMIWCWRTGEESVAAGSVMPATALMQSAMPVEEQELGVANPLDNDGDTDDTAKSQIAKEEASVDTVTQETGGLTKAVEDAIAKATQPLQERIKALDAELAKVKATPVPSGLVLSRNVQVKQPGAVVNEDYAAKAAYYREMAETVTDRPTADGYRKLAREADAKAVTPTS